MIDDFAIFARSGLILWRKSFVKLRGDPLARLVQTVLLEDRAAQPELVCDGYTVRWTLANDLGLVYAVVYQTALPPAYALDLLASVRTDFGKRYADAVADPTEDEYSSFDPHFDRLLRAAENESLSRAAAARIARTKPANATVLPRPVRAANPSVELSTKTSSATGDPGTSQNSALSPGKLGNDRTHTSSEQLSGPEAGMDQVEDPEEVIRRNREAFLRKRSGATPASRSRKSAGDFGRTSGSMGSSSSSSGLSTKRAKAPGKSEDTLQEDVEALDFSADKSDSVVNRSSGSKDVVSDAEVARFVEQFVKAKPNTSYTILEDADAVGEEDDVAPELHQDVTKSDRSTVFDFFKGLAGMRNLERRDLEPALAQFRDALIGKNVAQEIADRVIESVATNLEGKRLESMTTVTTTVRKALEEALTRILTPRQSVDILAEISAKKGSGRPYVIAFCGVNGVGKSTSLAKTCFYLINNGYKVMIAACDTFRAGAVEQLRTHVRCLGENAELFDRGYGKDAASVAMDAVRRAKELHYDVVLIDTAGRMQDNEPLMRALSKLVEVNQPDRLFFVGEALVGNDAVDQLKKFNAALADHQRSPTPRLIDGIVLTKFDTIDDKVGAAVSMVYTTGQPVVFVGVGQTYMDLRKVNTKSLVNALLK